MGETNFCPWICHISWDLDKLLRGPFWAAFWPECAATVLGILLGVPVALAIERSRAAREAAGHDAQRRQRRDTLIHLLDDALRHNASELRSISTILEGPGVPSAIVTRMEAWSILRDEAIDLLPGPTLQTELATHFEAVRLITADAREQAARVLLKAGQPYLGATTGQQVSEVEASIKSRLAK